MILVIFLIIASSAAAKHLGIKKHNYQKLQTHKLIHKVLKLIYLVLIYVNRRFRV